MKKNSKRSKRHSVMATRTAYIGTVIIMLFAMVVVNILADSRCTHLMKSIGEKKRALARLGDEETRECARWEEMKTPEKLERALWAHGMSMKYARPEQTIKMRGDGKPYAAQIAVARATRRLATDRTAMNVRTRR